MATVLVTDGNQRAGLAVTRSLGRSGYEVIVVSSIARSIAGGSRYCAREVQVPDSLTSPSEFTASLVQLADEVSADALVPITESSLLAVLGERERFGRTVIPFASLVSFERVSDKSRVLAAATELGIANPTLATAGSTSDLLELASCWGATRYPVVLKPIRSVVSSRGVRSTTSVLHIDDGTELERAAQAFGEQEFPILVQRKIEGPGVGIFLLRWNGQVRAVFAHRRVREKPPSGGVSVVRESIDAPPRPLDDATRLLEALEFEGVAMIEFKVDSETGEYFLMEINGRFWGSLQLAVDAGVDFPLLLLESALGKEPRVPPSYETGLRLRWMLGDFDHLIARMTKTRAALRLDPSAPGKIRTLGGFLRDFFPPTRQEVLRTDDLGPAIREVRQWLQHAWSRS